jgi:hypothetical protein
VMALAQGTIINGIMARVCAWVVDRVDPGRSVTITSISIVMARAARRATVVAGQVMRRVLRLMMGTSRVKARAIRAVGRATVVVVRVMRQGLRLMKGISRVRARATRAVGRVTAVVVRVLRLPTARVGVSEPSALQHLHRPGCSGMRLHLP